MTSLLVTTAPGSTLTETTRFYETATQFNTVVYYSTVISTEQVPTTVRETSTTISEVSGPTQTVSGPTQTQIYTTSYVETYISSYPVTVPGKSKNPETYASNCCWELALPRFFMQSTSSKLTFSFKDLPRRRSYGRQQHSKQLCYRSPPQPRRGTSHRHVTSPPQRWRPHPLSMAQ